ncbi:MAG: glycine--tRNA ligase subunit beta [Gammaproteobacteria bacterium]
MISTASCLIELGVEELPLKAPLTLSLAFKKAVEQRLTQVGISFDHIRCFATPRRLALLISQCASETQPQQIQKRGPALNAAFNEAGQPTKACEGFARSCGVTVEQLERITTDKGTWLSYTEEKPGEPIEQWLPPLVKEALASLPIPKPMSWGSEDHRFVRPVHWLVLMFGQRVIPATLYGCSSQAVTHGHRFHSTTPLTLISAEHYESLLEEKGHVIPCFAKRQHHIEKQLQEQGKKHQCTFITTTALLQTVTSLVEWPEVLVGQFKKTFLDVPAEVLISAIHTHQKAFHGIDHAGNLMPCFAFVSNIHSSDPLCVIQGNKRVMTARLADAAFFYEMDKHQSLFHRLPMLAHVTFQTNLGSLENKARRLEQLAAFIATTMKSDSKLAARAALLAKTDLVTDMVGEFPELQGTMGAYYALNDKEEPAVATAIGEHYYPRFGGDALPATAIGCYVALADKLDTVVSIFSIGKMPTGEKDPFGLRRAGLGLLRIIIEKQLPLDLKTLLQETIKTLPTVKDNDHHQLLEQCFAFLLDRLRAWYQSQQITTDIINAVMCLKPTSPLDFHHRIQGVHRFRQLPESTALAAANKRVSKLLTKANVIDADHTFQEDRLKEPAEHHLAALVKDKKTIVLPLFKAGQYKEALEELAQLQPAIDVFFDKVMVMVDDKALQENRLALLGTVRDLFLHAADISQLQ